MKEVKTILNEDSRKAFDLESGPLYRLHLIKTATDEHYFHMSIHHIIFDGWSQGVFVKDFNEIYNSLIREEEPKLGTLKYQQYDYAQWEANEHVKEESVKYWEANLNGCSPVLNFPYDYPRNEKSSGRGGLEGIKLSKSLSDELRRISKEQDSSLFTTLLSVFGVQLHMYSGEDDLNIGLPVTYRPHSGLEQVVGMFVNTVVVRLKYKKGDTLRNLIRQTSNEAMNAIQHQDVSFDMVVEAVKPERFLNTNPLFQVAFVWQNNLYESLTIGRYQR